MPSGSSMPHVCIHLDQSPDSDYAKYFCGVGTDYALICELCRSDPKSIESHLRIVAPERSAEIEAEGCWVSDEDAILGTPGIRERSTALSFVHDDVAPDGIVPGTLSDLRPIDASDQAACLALTQRGELLRIEPFQPSVRCLGNVGECGMDVSRTLSLRVSPCGDLAAIVEAKGRHGVVLDLTTMRPSMTLDRGTYHVEQTPFPAAFFEIDGQLRLVHGTDWNRLDISDPRSGRLLTERSPTSYRRDEIQPEHYLDYFHGELTVSPRCERIADNGWVWHPVGIVVAWDLRRWASENPWESEDGPSKRSLCDRSYFWRGPLCWIDDRNLAAWGYGNDDLNLIPAALIYDAETGELLRWFPGPVGNLVFDNYLFSYSAEAGTAIWDVETSERLHSDPEFRPMAYHRGALRFVTITPDGGIRLSRLVDSPS